jgi:hypothetical protein
VSSAHRSIAFEVSSVPLSDTNRRLAPLGHDPIERTGNPGARVDGFKIDDFTIGTLATNADDIELRVNLTDSNAANLTRPPGTRGGPLLVCASVPGWPSVSACAHI